MICAMSLQCKLRAWACCVFLLLSPVSSIVKSELRRDSSDSKVRSNSSAELRGYERHKVLRMIPVDSTKPPDGVQVRVLQLHGRAPVPPEDGREATNEEELLREFDEVTIAWRAPEAVHSVLLRLPEKQETESVAHGYMFRAAENHECWGNLKRYKAQKLPWDNETDHPIKGTELVSTGRMSRCAVENFDEIAKEKKGGADPRPSRAAMMMQLHQPAWVNYQHGWQFFTVFIRNAAVSPTGQDINGNTANSFQVVLNGTYGKTLAEMSFQALPIQPVWVCGYTNWIRSTPCTADCGGGFRLVTRRQLHSPPPDFNPLLLINCDEAWNKTESCNVHDCDIDCYLSDWTPWNGGECSRSCGGGSQVLRRSVITAATGNGTICPPWHSKERVKTMTCNTQPCPERCVLSPKMKELERGGPLKAALGIAKSSCSKPCGGGRRKIQLPLERKDTMATCEFDHRLQFVEECNMFPCKPLLFIPGAPWQFPVMGQWFLVDIIFTLEELAESLAIRAPVDFLLAATGDDNACYLVEHSLPTIERCVILAGEAGEVGPLVQMNFSNPLEPLPPGQEKRDWHFIRTWVQHPKECKVGQTDDGICRGLPGERDWSLSVDDQLPSELWEMVKGSYEIFVDEESANRSIAARVESGMHPLEEAERVDRSQKEENESDTEEQQQQQDNKQKKKAADSSKHLEVKKKRKTSVIAQLEKALAKERARLAEIEEDSALQPKQSSVE
eukprot:TRINITY_DN93670_c0_g1_i1.p1 TRINITY_DN93670_c0_g1~~TRINITY_DN93670_c0_g1_i1.p1  ORF type:complete len:729 (-),score=176.98 TRINITY_DN93670_c0_g1_i1:33-2219(-)